MLHDDPLKALPGFWADAEVPAGLAERIVLRARATPQRRSWWQPFVDSLVNWDSAWNIKGPVLAAFLMLGLLGGQLGSGSALSDMPSHFSWTEDL